MAPLSDCLLFQGLSLAVGSYNGEDVLVSFGGYNGRYNNEVRIRLQYTCGLLCSYSMFLLNLFLDVRLTFLNQATSQPCNQR